MSERAEQLAKQFMSHRAVTQDLASRIPDDKVGYAPWEGAMGAGALLLHVANAHHALTAVAAGKEPVRPDPATLPTDMPGIRSHVARLTEEDAAAIRALTDEQLQQNQTGFGGRATQPGEGWLRSAREHEIHHKGQLFTYARMNGIEPPSGYVKR